METERDQSTIGATPPLEAFTQRQLDALVRAVGDLVAMIGGLNDVDVSRGRGKLSDREHCVWTIDGRRIAIVITSDGGCMISCAKTADPHAPASGTFA